MAEVVVIQEGPEENSIIRETLSRIKVNRRDKVIYFQAYKFLAKILFRNKNIEHIAAHAFLFLELNLIVWADNCVGDKVERI